MSTAVPIDPLKLLEAAQRQAGTNRGRGRPSPVQLRSAVSNAYYALFHALSRRAAEHLFRRGTRQQKLRLARTFGHRDLKVACSWVAGREKRVPQHVRSIVDFLKGSPIEGIAASFCDLQEARHQADYDHLMPFSKATTLAHIADSRTAIDALDKANERQRQAFFALLALCARPGPS
jgi:hypothetical protein